MEEDEFRLSLKTPYDARKISGRIVLLSTLAHKENDNLGKRLKNKVVLKNA
jgi:hypothetical protein